VYVGPYAVLDLVVAYLTGAMRPLLRAWRGAYKPSPATQIPRNETNNKATKQQGVKEKEKGKHHRSSKLLSILTPTSSSRCYSIYSPNHLDNTHHISLHHLFTFLFSHLRISLSSTTHISKPTYLDIDAAWAGAGGDPATRRRVAPGLAIGVV
jgi:hypothetical protein